jgi:dipeptidyl aminopeptidase/acylaminoacyl peptidase
LKLGNDVLGLAFTPDGRKLVATAAGVASVWDTTDGKRLFEWHHRGTIRSVAVSPDGQRCAISSDRVVQIWSLATGERTGILEHNVLVLCVTFSPDGNVLATGDGTGRIRFWQVADSRESAPSFTHAGAATSIRFSVDGKRVATASADHTARVWDVSTRRAVTRPLTHGGEVTSASLNPDGRFVLTASIDGTARVWSVATSLPVTDPLAHGNRVTSAEWSPDGQKIVTASWDSSGRIWSLPLLHSAPANPEVLADIAEAYGGLRLSRDETTQRVGRDRLAGIQQQIEKANDETDFNAWMRWLLADRATRPLAPGVTVTAEEHARARFADNKPDRVRQALQLAPMDAQGLARWSRLVLQQNEERNPRKFAEALSTAELATKIDPGCFDAWCSLANARLAGGEVESARLAFQRAQEARPETLSAADQRTLADLHRRIERAAPAAAPGAR